MNREEALSRLLAAVSELVDPRVTITVIPGWSPSRNRILKPHRVEHDALLVELAQAIYPVRTAVDGGVASVPGSRSPARDDAIDRLRAIEAGVVEWRIRLGLQPRGTLADDLRALLGAAQGHIEDGVVVWLARDAARWVTWANFVTGWKTPPTLIHKAPCLECGVTSKLLVRWDEGVACCLACGTDWRKDDGGIYILADHVRMCTEGESA